MDATRFCYKAPCQFTVGGPLVDIHWYWADEEASVYLLPHAFPAMVGYRQFKITEGVGERWERWPRHASVFGPPGVEDIAVDGTPEQFLGQGVFGPIIWANLPNCKFPIVFNDNIINIDAEIAVSPITAGIQLDAVATVRESGLVLIELPSERIKETACIDLLFTGVPGEGGVLLFDASTKSAKETGGLDIDAESFDADSPFDPDDAESVSIDLAAETLPIFPPADKAPAEVLIDGEQRKVSERPELDLYVTDGGVPPDDQNSRILISEETGSFSGSGSGGGGGGGGGDEPGESCDDAMMMENGVTYDIDAEDGGPGQWFKFWLPGDMGVTIAYRTNSGPDRKFAWNHGDCDSLTAIRTTFEPLISFDYGPSGVDEWIVGFALTIFGDDANYSIRCTTF